MHSKIVVGINDVGIRPAPDGVLPTNGSPYRSRSIPDSFVQDREIDRIESIEQRGDAIVNQEPRVIDIEGWPIGISIYTIRTVIGIRQPHDCSLKGRINNRPSRRRQSRSWRHRIGAVISLDPCKTTY